MEKKSPKPQPAASEESSFMHKAGEILHSIGSHLVDAKDAVAETVAKEIKVVKKAIKKKSAAKKKGPATKKTAKKPTVKKNAKKPSPKKPLSKFARKAKKAAKKSASNRMKK
jgi:hypothetical protein